MEAERSKPKGNGCPINEKCTVNIENCVMTKCPEIIKATRNELPRRTGRHFPTRKGVTPPHR
jgi:hypothetical protein